MTKIATTGYGKGDIARRIDKAKFDENFDRIFGKKEKEQENKIRDELLEKAENNPLAVIQLLKISDNYEN